jgi:O-antigen ligase
MSASDTFVLLAIGCLPFSHAMTVQASFPIKSYEILVALALCCDLAQGKFRYPARLGRTLLLIVIGWSVIFWEFIYSMLWHAPGFSATELPGRFSPEGVGLSRLVYFLLDITILAYTARLAFERPRQLAAAWIAGAVVSGCYLFYCFLSSAAGRDPVILPGMQERLQDGTLAGITFLRQATFREGNYAGLYFLISSALAFHMHHRKAALFLLASTLLTVSTGAFLVTGLLAALMTLHWSSRFSVTIRFIAVPVVLIFLATVVLLGAQNAIIQESVVAKLDVSAYSQSSESLFERIDGAWRGLLMFLERPLTGVGIGQYAYHYHALGSVFIPEIKIPNNAIAEILSELGLIGMTLAGAFLWTVYRRARDSRSAILTATTVCVIIGMMATPTYLFGYFWAYFGLILGLHARVESEGGDTSTDPVPAVVAP